MPIRLSLGTRSGADSATVDRGGSPELSTLEPRLGPRWSVAGVWVGDPNERGELLGTAGELIRYGQVVCVDPAGTVWLASYARAADGQPPRAVAALAAYPGDPVYAPLRFHWARFFGHPNPTLRYRPVYLHPDMPGFSAYVPPTAPPVWQLGRQVDIWWDAEYAMLEWAPEQLEEEP